MKNLIIFREKIDVFNDSVINRERLRQSHVCSPDMNDILDHWGSVREDITASMDRAKMFIINDEEIDIISNTDPCEYGKTPFKDVFLDVSLKIGDEEVNGILLQSNPTNVEKDDLGKDYIRITTFPTSKNIVAINIFGLNMPDNTLYFNDLYQSSVYKLDEKKNRQIADFVLSFLNFLYTKDIEIIDVREYPLNESRIRKGKPKINDIVYVRHSQRYKMITDHIRYLRDNHIKFDHSWWVRGHFRRLQAERYSEKKVLWIEPFIKGHGILIDKKYKVED